MSESRPELKRVRIRYRLRERQILVTVLVAWTLAQWFIGDGAAPLETPPPE